MTRLLFGNIVWHWSYLVLTAAVPAIECFNMFEQYDLQYFSKRSSYRLFPSSIIAIVSVFSPYTFYQKASIKEENGEAVNVDQEPLFFIFIFSCLIGCPIEELPPVGPCWLLTSENSVQVQELHECVHITSTPLAPCCGHCCLRYWCFSCCRLSCLCA